MFFRAIAAALCFISLQAIAQRDLQQSLYKYTPTAYYATIPIERWTGFDGATVSADAHVDVQGTAFLVNSQGDFVTAAHVLEGWEPRKPGVCALMRQRSGGGSCFWFDVIEKDDQHDLALCHLFGFPLKLQNETSIPYDSRRPVASFKIRQQISKMGEIVLLTGYPLDMNLPSSKLGLVSSIHNLQGTFPGKALGVKKDSYDLLQVSVSANHGDSGGPLISLETGEVIGVLLQIVPAPIAIQGQNVINQGTYAMSGLFLVAPSIWVAELLRKNNVHSEAIPVERKLDF